MSRWRLGLILATCFIYFLYTPFDDWSYLRFLLPAIALMIVLASVVTVHVVTYAFDAFSRRLGASASKSSVVSGFSRTVILCGHCRGCRSLLRAQC